jgi:copper chaperone
MAYSTPLQFDVPDMNDESSVQAIQKAVRRVDPSAHVVADLESKRVIIGSEASAQEFAEAIAAAGFTIKAAE